MRRLSPPDDPYCERCGAYLDDENQPAGRGRCWHCEEREPCDHCDEYMPDTDLEDGLCAACAEELARCEGCGALPDVDLEDGLCAACVLEDDDE